MSGRTGAAAALRRLRALASPARAAASQRFFKTGPGEYGAGDRFLGLTVPRLRSVLREFDDLSLPQVEKLLESPWHEARLLAVLILGRQYPRAGEAERARIYRLYLRRTDRINNWDLVDASAPNVVGAHLFGRSREPLQRLARSRSVWERRIAIISTFYFIRRNEVAETVRIARLLLDDDHDLIHKAVGWALREVGKRDVRVLLAFLDRDAGRMPRTALRYALERLPAATRKRHMATPRAPRKSSQPRRPKKPRRPRVTRRRG